MMDPGRRTVQQLKVAVFHWIVKFVTGTGTAKGTVTELLTPDTEGGVSFVVVTMTKLCPVVTLTVQLAVAANGVASVQGTTVPGAPGTGTLVS